MWMYVGTVTLLSLLKYGEEKITQWVFNSILDFQTILQVFKHSIIILVHKGKNYNPLLHGLHHGISVVLVLAKELVIVNWIQPILQEQKCPTSFRQHSYISQEDILH